MDIEKQIQFATSAVPGLKTGIYKTQIVQKTNVIGLENGSAEMTFGVSGNPVSMGEGEVYSVFPPINSTGKYEACLPHIIMHRKTLPWEMELDLDNPNQNIPYLVLMSFSDKEEVQEFEMTFGESKAIPNSNPNAFIPSVEDEFIDDSLRCKMIKVPGSLLMDVLPREADLPYMAHIRGVDLNVKVTDETVKDNCFSCLVCNRYPDTLGPNNKSLKHTCYVVNLQGYEEWIKDSADRSNADIRNKDCYLYTQYNWSFYVQAEEYNFYVEAKNIDVNTLQLNADTEELKQSGDKDGVERILNLGFCPVEHQMRDGSTTVSWYHPPLLPQQPEVNIKENYYTLSDQLLQYDSETGMFDITYSAAWELGRMLALKDQKFSQNLLQWRIENKGKAIEKLNLKSIVGQIEYYIPDDTKKKPIPTELTDEEIEKLKEVVYEVCEAVIDNMLKLFSGILANIFK